MCSKKTQVVNPLTWEQIDSFPLANDSMSEAELRQLVLDFFRLTLRFPWTPSKTFDFAPRGKVIITFEEGKVYGGTPYVAGTLGNIYTMMEYYNPENGMLNLDNGLDTIVQFSNQCSGSTFWAWQRVCSSVNFGGTSDSIEKNGCLRVGPYTYSDEIYDFYFQKRSTNQVCEENGTDTMFESYAQLKIADGIVNYNNAGHVRMICALPVVVRDENGKIDGEQSMLTFIDQDGEWREIAQPDGSPYTVTGGDQRPLSFQQAFKEGYLPFTFAELNKQKPIDKSQTTMDYSGQAISISNLKKAVVTCNYSISDITLTVKNAEGKQVYRKLSKAYFPTIPVHTAKVKISVVPKELWKFADGKHTVEISARIGTGEKPVVYTGNLAKNHFFFF